MKRLDILYTVIITAAVLAGTTVVVALYQAGSQAVPFWRSAFVPGPLSARHAFLSDKCESCHTPVRGVEAKTCVACHASAATDLAKQSTAFHASIQNCRGCHVEHEGTARPTRMDHAALARIGADLTGGAHPGLSAQIGEDVAAYFGIRSAAKARETALNCVSCHSYQDPHRQLFGTDCADCHATTNWRIAAFLHPSPTSRDCAQCHQAPPSHYMGHFRMVSMMIASQRHADVSQCHLCHLTNSFNEIKGAGWYKHH